MILIIIIIYLFVYRKTGLSVFWIPCTTLYGLTYLCTETISQPAHRYYIYTLCTVSKSVNLLCTVTKSIVLYSVHSKDLTSVQGKVTRRILNLESVASVQSL